MGGIVRRRVQGRRRFDCFGGVQCLNGVWIGLDGEETREEINQ